MVPTKVKNLFRWIAILPGSILGGILITFPLHWVLYLTFVKGEIISGLDIKPIEYNLYPFIIAIAFVLSGFNLAPKYKFKIALSLGILWIVSFVMVYIILPNSQVQFGIRSIGSLVGSILGVFIAWKNKTN